MQASGMFPNTLWIYVKTHLCSSRSGCCCRSDDCFESYTERELLRKIAHSKAGNFGDTSEIVPVVSWDIECGGLNEGYER